MGSRLVELSILVVVRKLSRIYFNPFWIFTVAELFFRFYGLAFSLPAQTDSDSASYRSGNGFTNWGWVSLTGVTYGRGWPLIALYSTVKHDDGRIVIQAAINIIAWIIFGYVGNTYFKDNRARNIFLVSVFIFSNLASSQNFNNWIGRESLSFSLLLLATTSIMYLWFTNRMLYFWIAALIIDAFAITKPTLIFIAIGYWILLSFYLEKHARNPRGFIFNLISVLVLTVYVLINIANQNTGWSRSDPTGRSEAMINYSYLLSDFNPEANRLRLFFATHGAPECATRKVIGVANSLGSPMEYAATLHTSCRGFDKWVANHFYVQYLRYLVERPEDAFNIIKFQIHSSLAFMPSGNTFAILPNIFEFHVFQISILNICIFAAFALFLIFNLEKRQKKQMIFDSKMKFVLLALVFTFLGVFFSLLVQPTHASDINRQNYVSILFVQLIIIVYPIFLYDEKRVQNVIP